MLFTILNVMKDYPTIFTSCKKNSHSDDNKVQLIYVLAQLIYVLGQLIYVLAFEI